MSAATRFSAIDNAVCGSIHGDIYLFRFPAMYVDKAAINSFNLDKIKKLDMALTRGYTAHTSMILGTEVSDLLSLNLAIRRQIYFNYISI
jgi:hypothetical protein